MIIKNILTIYIIKYYKLLLIIKKYFYFYLIKN